MDKKPAATNGRLYAVFGKPVLHSKSPQLFSHFLCKGDNYIRIRPQTAGELVSIIKLLNIQGASITSPFKEDIISLVDELTEAALTVGAVNCIRHENGFITGHNTDAVGVTGAFKEAGVNLRSAKVLVLGAGGAAKAAIYGLTKAGAEVYISNRTQEKAKALEKKFGAICIPWESPGQMPYFDAIVSALLPEAIPPYAGYLSYGCLLDAVYKPSKMTDYSLSCGKKVIPGERWLIYQGIAAADFYMFQNKKPTDRPVLYRHQQIKSKLAGNAGYETMVRLMDKNLNVQVNPANIRTLVLNEHTVRGYYFGGYDLIVSGFGFDENEIQLIIDEEKRLAFGS